MRQPPRLASAGEKYWTSSARTGALLRGYSRVLTRCEYLASRRNAESHTRGGGTAKRRTGG